MSSHEHLLESNDASAFIRQEEQLLTILKAAYAGELIASVSSPVIHDLSQPLVAIRFYADLLLQRLQDHSDPQLSKIASNIANLAQTSTESLSALRGFLSYREGEFKSGNLSDLMQNLLQIIRVDCKAAKIDLDVNISPNLMIRGDFQQLRLAIHALIKIVTTHLLTNLESKSVSIHLYSEGGRSLLVPGKGEKLKVDASTDGLSSQNSKEEHKDQDLGLFLSRLILSKHHAYLLEELDSSNAPLFRVDFPLI
jgi:C4-dicarboxylate-specific signal transduction histidine kinase